MGKTIYEAAIERALDRRQFSYAAYIPERRRGMEAKKHTKEELRIEETRNALLLHWERLRILRDVNRDSKNENEYHMTMVHQITAEGLDHGIDHIESILKDMEVWEQKGEAPETEA